MKRACFGLVAGPVPIFSFDPKTKKFAQEWNAPDEQLDIFHEFSADEVDKASGTILRYRMALK